MATKKQTDSTIYVERVRTEGIVLALLGTSPLVCNRMSKKAQEELLYPGRRKTTTADRQAALKHSPIEEYRASPYTLPDGDALLAVPASAVKGAMLTGALDLPGARKAQIGRLVYVEGDYLPVFGVPQLFMSIVRQAGINRTPDIRTRAIVPNWAVLARITYVIPLLNATSIVNLLSAAGKTAGIGDWRPEKGKGNYGQFEVVMEEDPTFQVIREAGGREAQQAALESPAFYDGDTEYLYEWFTAELNRRGK